MGETVLIDNWMKDGWTPMWDETPDRNRLRKFSNSRSEDDEVCGAQQCIEQRRRTHHELLLARDLQCEMLPPGHPPEAGWDLSARCVAAQTVGGDFYDFFRYSNKGISAEAIGDVSGKGASAAIYAALVVGLLRSLEVLELGPADMLRTLNKALLKRPVRAKYLSLIYATWDERERVFRIANAGLPYPVVVHDGKSYSLKVGGLPLGLFEDAQYEEHALACNPGDLVVFHTDGLTEAVNDDGDYFGCKRLKNLIAAKASETAERVVDSIFSSVASHARGLETFDDQTVVAVRT
jgi:phosphoserine phosphatase RsbU/P